MDNHDTQTELPDVRTRIAIIACLVSLLCPMLALIPLFTLVGSTEFAGDFDGGTHDADYSGIPIAGILLIGAVVSALIGAIFGRGGARAICTVMLIIPLAVVLGSAVNALA